MVSALRSQRNKRFRCRCISVGQYDLHGDGNIFIGVSRLLAGNSNRAFTAGGCCYTQRTEHLREWNSQSHRIRRSKLYMVTRKRAFFHHGCNGNCEPPGIYELFSHRHSNEWLQCVCIRRGDRDEFCTICSFSPCRCSAPLFRWLLHVFHPSHPERFNI